MSCRSHDYLLLGTHSPSASPKRFISCTKRLSLESIIPIASTYRSRSITSTMPLRPFPSAFSRRSPSSRHTTLSFAGCIWNVGADSGISHSQFCTQGTSTPQPNLRLKYFGHWTQTSRALPAATTLYSVATQRSSANFESPNPPYSHLYTGITNSSLAPPHSPTRIFQRHSIVRWQRRR